MTTIGPLLSLSAAGMAYGLILLLVLFTLLLIPGLLTAGSRPAEAAKAAYCFLMQMLGVVLLAVGALPALASVLEKLTVGTDRLSTQTYVALLIVFAAGGLTFLWHETLAQRVDQTSRRPYVALFSVFWKAVGYLLLLVSVLSFFLTLLLVGTVVSPGWWIWPSLGFAFGSLLSWLTRDHAGMGVKAAPSVLPARYPTPMKSSKKMPKKATKMMEI